MQLPTSRQRKINTLAYEKFPKTKIESPFFNKYNAIDNSKPDLSAFDVSKRSPELKKEFELAEIYKQELEKLSDEEIEKLHTPIAQRHEEEKKKKVAQAELELFSFPNTVPDYDYWCKFDYWTVDEFIALSFGKNPKIINSSYLEKNSCSDMYRHGFIEALKFPQEYRKRFDLLSRSIMSISENFKELGERALPLENRRMNPQNCISWALGKDIPLPKEISAIYKNEKQTVEDSHKKWAQLKEDYENLNAQTKTYSENVTRLESNNKELSDKYEKLKAEKSLDIREKRSLLKMIYGMAKVGYGWEPEFKKSKVAIEIMTDVNNSCKQKISDDAVRKWLKEAKDLDDSADFED